MFRSMFLNVNSSFGSYGKLTKMKHYAHMSYCEIGKDQPIYAENLMTGKKENQISLDDLPDNLRLLRKLAIELAGKYNTEEFNYRYSEFKGIFEIGYSNREFGNEDQMSVFISEAALYNDDVKEDIAHLTDPKNPLIDKVMDELSEDYKLFKKTNNGNRDIYSFDKIETFYNFNIKLYSPEQLGDQRIKNLLNNRLYSKYFITEPFK